jgi:predicted ribosomally synthesized peptide with nif11-like leader
MYQELTAMSKATVNEFFKSLESDEVLQRQVKSVSSSDEIVQIASTRGYEFNVQDLQEYMREADENEELSIDELEAVAGGLGDTNNNNNNKK